MKKNIKKIFKKILLIGIIIYLIYIFFSQQKMLNLYKADKENFQKEIAIEKEEQERLKQIKSNINSNEYIENIAREKLDMYLPNEKLYIDISK